MSTPFIRLACDNTRGKNATAPPPSPEPHANAQFEMRPNEFPPFPSLPHDSTLNRPLMDPGDTRLDAGAWGAKMNRRLSERVAEARAVRFAAEVVDGDSCDSDDGSRTPPPPVHTVTPSPTPSEVEDEVTAELLIGQFAGMDFVDGTVDMSADNWHVRDPLMQSLSPVNGPDDVEHFEVPHEQQHQALQQPLHPMPLVTPGEAYWRACAEHWQSMCLEMQNHVSLVCVPLAPPSVDQPFPFPC